MTTKTKNLDNIAFVKEMMTYSQFGALAQMFILDAIAQWSKRVAAAPPIEHPMINGEAWKGVAQEIQRKLNERGRPDREARDRELIQKIAMRAARPTKAQSRGLIMTLTELHFGSCPLRLADLYKADQFNFDHDTYGIEEHYDIATHKLKDLFRPRFAVRGKEKVS